MNIIQAASGIVTVIAGTNLSGHVVVRIENGIAYSCGSDNQAYIGHAIGITTGGALAGGTIAVQLHGELTEPTWSFTPGFVWIGSGGILTQTAPTTGFLQTIGRAINATVLQIDLSVPVNL
jgi:hypothetical protein